MNDAIVTIATVTIPSVLTLIGCMVNNNMQRTKDQHAIEMRIAEINANYDKSTAIIETKIDELTEHVNKHNNLVERMYEVEGKQKHILSTVEDIRHDISRLEGDHK